MTRILLILAALLGASRSFATTGVSYNTVFVDTATAVSTDTPAFTATVIFTATPQPTVTPRPTDTPQPTLTAQLPYFSTAPSTTTPNAAAINVLSPVANPFVVQAEGTTIAAVAWNGSLTLGDSTASASTLTVNAPANGGIDVNKSGGTVGSGRTYAGPAITARYSGGFVTCGVLSTGVSIVDFGPDSTHRGFIAYDSTTPSTRIGGTSGALEWDSNAASGVWKLAAPGKNTKYNNETTDGVGLEYVEKVGQDVAATNAGAQNTTIATFTVATSGFYVVYGSISAVTANASVTVVVTYTDAVNTTAQTVTVVNALSMGANSVTQFACPIRCNTTTAALCKFTNSNQNDTKGTAGITRLN